MHVQFLKNVANEAAMIEFLKHNCKDQYNDLLSTEDAKTEALKILNDNFHELNHQSVIQSLYDPHFDLYIEMTGQLL